MSRRWRQPERNKNFPCRVVYIARKSFLRRMFATNCLAISPLLIPAILSWFR